MYANVYADNIVYSLIDHFNIDMHINTFFFLNKIQNTIENLICTLGGLSSSLKQYILIAIEP